MYTYTYAHSTVLVYTVIRVLVVARLYGVFVSLVRDSLHCIYLLHKEYVCIHIASKLLFANECGMYYCTELRTYIRHRMFSSVYFSLFLLFRESDVCVAIRYEKTRQRKECTLYVSTVYVGTRTHTHRVKPKLEIRRGKCTTAYDG